MPENAPHQGFDEASEASGADTGDLEQVPGDELVADSSTIELVEVFPNVVAAFGQLPADLELFLEPLNTGLLSALDRDHINNALATVGNSATVGGNLAQTAANMQGLYRMADESRALLDAGGKLAVKDGKNLGTIFLPKGSAKTMAQARFTPAAGLTVATAAAAIGPALAMVALQAQLNEVSTLVQKNIELTHQVIENTRREERARLMSLVDTVDQALADARAAGSVPASLWATFASKKADLGTERKKYRANVEDHVKKIAGSGVAQRRDYLQRNAQAIVFDAFALLETLKAWTGYQALAAAVAREAGVDNPAEAKHFDSIVANTRRDFEADLGGVTKLLGSLTRELRIIVDLPGPASLKLSSKRKDIDATRKLATTVLNAIAPLADALLPIRDPLTAPRVVCAPATVDLEPHLRVLRWLLETDEELRVLGVGAQTPAHGKVGAVVGAAKDKIASALDKDPDRLMVAITDRRILTSNTNTFFKEAVWQHDIPLSEVRYVRSNPGDGEALESRVDLITRGHNHDWYFAPDVEPRGVDALAAILAESMALPEEERYELSRRHAVIDEPKPELSEAPAGGEEVGRPVGST